MYLILLFWAKMLTVNAKLLNEIALSHKSKVGGKNYHLVVVSLGAVFTKLWRPQVALREENVGVMVLPEGVYIVMGNFCVENDFRTHNMYFKDKVKKNLLYAWFFKLMCIVESITDVQSPH